MRKALKISRYIPSSSQAKLNLFVSEKRVSLALEHHIEPMVRQALSAILAVLIFAYLYFVAASIFHIMARKEANSAVFALQGSIAALESQYFALSHAIEPESGIILGLSPVSDTHYVYRPGNAASALTQTTGRIGGNEI